jgi:hypothetical protein
MLFIFIGVAYCGVMVLGLVIWAALHRIKTPKPTGTDWKKKG